MQKTVRLAQVGYGYWGPNLYRNILSTPGVELVALCDKDPATLDKLKKKNPGLALYSSFEDLMEKASFDGVVIASPADQHHKQTLLALKNRKHVLVEKPLANSLQESIELVQAADTAGSVLMVGHTFLYNNVVREVKKLIQSGELGDVYYVYSQRLNLGRIRKDSDVLWTLAPHDVSIINYWFDARPTEVGAQGFTFISQAPEIPDVGFAQLHYPGGKKAHLHMSWLDPQKKRLMVIVGSKKMLVYDDMNADAHIQIYDKRVEKEWRDPIENFADFTTRIRAGDLLIPNVKLIEPLSVEIQHFVECIQGGKKPITDGVHGLEVVAALEAMTQSRKRGGITIPVDYASIKAKS